jgi:hypothetical protein
MEMAKVSAWPALALARFSQSPLRSLTSSDISIDLACGEGQVVELGQYFDGNWIDIGAILTAIFYACRQHRRCNPPKKFISKDTGLDFANGTGLFPLFVLACSSLSHWLATQLLSATKITLSIAGVTALLSMLED